MVEKQT